MTLEDAAAAALEAAESAGATDAEAWAEESRGLEVRVYKEAVESLTDAGGRGLGLRVFVDGRVGYAYGTDLSAEGLRDLAEAAHAGAAAADSDEFEGLPDEFGATAVEGLHSAGMADWTTDRKIELAIAVDRAARAPQGSDAGRADRVRGLTRARRAREQPRLPGGLRGLLRMVVLVGVRG